MGKVFKNLFSKSLAILAMTSLIVTSVNAITLADTCDENGHVPGHVEIVTDPTCTTAGEAYNFCTICGEYLGTEAIPALGHQNDGGTRAAEPTCTQDGAIKYKCVRCGEELHTESIPATGHQKDGGNVLTVATCTQPGITQYRCSKCGTDMGTDNTPALGHQSDAGTIVKQPTTTTQGEIEYKCVRCGTVLKEEPIPIIAKRQRPQAVFATDSQMLTNIPENSTVKINGTVISGNASGSLSLLNNFPQMGDYQITIIANANATSGESDPQVIATRKTKTPSHIQTVDEPATGGTGAIGGVDTSMEYSLQQPVNWITCTSSSQPVPAGIYIVRYKATSTSVASDSVEVLVKKASAQKPATPTATFDGQTHQIRGLMAGMVYSTNGGDTWTKVADAMVTLSADATNQAVSYKSILVKNIVQGVESDVETISVGRVSQPNGVSTTPATNGNNGSIKGVGSDMQYLKDGTTSWIDIGSNTVSGLAKGKYFVRRKASGNLVESNPVTIYVDDKTSSSKEGTPSASFNGYNMHIDGVSGCRLSFDGGKNWTDKIKDSTYVINESYLSTAYGIIVYRVGNGSTTDSDRQYITLCKQATPTGITATSATPTVPGTIIGTDVSMQYRPSTQSNWIDVTSNVIPVQAGTYYVRRHGYSNALPSDWLTVVINASATATQSTPNKVVQADTGKKNDTGIVVEKDATATDANKKQDTAKDTNKETNKETEDANSTEEIKEEAATGAEREIVELSGDNTIVESSVFVNAANQDTPLVIVADNQSVWSIDPADINVDQVNALNRINLGIVENPNSIPEEAIATVADASTSNVVDHTFDIKHEGNFGFTAKLTVKVNDSAKGKYANLYYYNTSTGKMEYVDSSLVGDEGEATFKMTHASSYAVVVSETAMSQDSVKEIKVNEIVSSDDTAPTEDAASTDTSKTETKTEKKSNTVVIILIVIIIALAAGLVLTLLRKKQSEEKAKHHKYH